MTIRAFALLTTAITGLGWAPGALAQDQEKPRSTADSVTEDAAERGDIVVVGTRKAIESSLERKREASAHIDVITAEDVTKYPDVNVAESLSRLPGVTIDRTAGGEGSKVAINGIDSRLINVQFNGQPIASAETGANNRDTGRSFNFRNLAPELIGTVEVYKTTEARLDEGGIGGSIIVNSRMPLDLPRGTLSVSTNYNMNLRNKEKDPRASLLYSWFTKDKTFGILGSVAYNKSVLGSGGVSTAYQNICNGSNYGGCTGRTGAAAGTFTDRASLPTVSSGPALTETMLVPSYIWLQQSTNNSIRKTAYLAVQAKPSDIFEVSVTGTKIWADYSSFSQTFQTDLSVPWNQREAFDAAGAPITKLSSVTTQEAGITGGTGNFAVRQDEYYKRSKLDTGVYNIRTRWAPGPLELIANAGVTQATGGVDPEYYLSFYGNTSGSFAMTPDGASLTLDRKPTDPTLFKTRTAGNQAGFVKTAKSLDRYEYGKLDGTLELNFGPLEKLLFGGRLQQHRSNNVASYFNTTFGQTGSMAGFDTYLSDPNLVSGLGSGGDLKSFVGLTPQGVIDFSVANKSPGNADRNFRDAANLWDTTEDTTAAYTQLNYKAGRFSGDLGVRYVKTENEQTYRSTLDYDPWFEEQITIKRAYDDWLPSFNLNYDATDQVKLRLAAGRVISRPTFADMSGQVEYSLDRYSTAGPFFAGTGGNPDVKPYRAWNYNTSAEWYFAKGSLLSVDLFYKDVSSYIVRKNTFVDVTLPNDAITYCNDNVIFCSGKVQRVTQMLINAPFNGSNAKIKGVSLNFTGNLIWGFGIQANGTYLHQKYGSFVDQYNVAGKLPLPYLSKWSYTISPYYERGPIQARISYTWRSKYITDVGSEVDAPQFISSWGQLDAQASYNVSDRLSVNVAAQNILDGMQHPFTTGGLPLSWSKYGTRLTAGVTFRMF